MPKTLATPDRRARTEDDERYRVLSEGEKTMGLALAGVGLTAVDYRNDTVVPDALAASLFGLEPHVPVTRAAFHDRIHPADRDAVLAEVDKLLDPSFEDAVELTHRTVAADGSTRWVHSRKRLYRDEGDPSRPASTGVAAILDITAQRIAEERSALLVRELQHRTANLLTVVSTIARMVARTGTPDAFLERFLPRIRALLERLPAVRPAEGSTLRGTITDSLAPFTVDERQLLLEGPEVGLTEAQAQTFAMVVHELGTNAVKYGALTRVSGRVEVHWSIRDGVLEFTWRERGGPPAAPPESAGFGTEVLQRYATLTLSATASMDYGKDGLRYRLSVPYPA